MLGAAIQLRPAGAKTCAALIVTPYPEAAHSVR